MVLIWIAVGIYASIEGEYKIVLFLVFCFVVTTAFTFLVGWLIGKMKK